MEKWIFINGEKSKYKISSEGYVISTKYNGVEGDVRPLKHNHDVDGYCIITLNHKGHKYTFKIHRLVALAFIPNPKELTDVNHKDGNKDNNDVTNLEWMSNVHNIYHALANNLRKSTNSFEDVRRVCELLSSSDYSIRKISEITGVKMADIVCIKNRVKWKELSEGYCFNNYKSHYAAGEANKASKITEELANSICMLLEKGYRIIDISKLLDVTPAIISRIRNRHTWKFVSVNYDF